MYSAGVTLLQMAFPSLRNDNALIAFNKKLREANWDLNKWRADEALSKRNGMWPKELQEGFEVLEADGGAGWDLLTKLMAYKPSDRLTAAAALQHPWLASAPFTVPTTGTALERGRYVADSLSSTVSGAIRSTAESLGTTGGSIMGSIEEVLPAGMVEDALSASNKGGLTEAFLLQEFGEEEAAPALNRNARQTIVWWQGRQQSMQKRIDARGGGKGSPTGTKEVAAAAGATGAAAAAAANGNGKSTNGNGKSAAGTKHGAGAVNANGAAKVKVLAPPPPGAGPAAPKGADAASRLKEMLSVFDRR
jgi:hypothetical protein